MSEAVWHSVKVVLRSGTDPEGEQADLLSALLFEAGMQGLETRDDLEPPELRVSFGPEQEPEVLAGVVVTALTEVDMPFEGVTVEQVQPIDWAEHWKKHFVPLQFGRLWVVPSWLESPEGADFVLRVDPSSAFGTGLHQTTALCLERIDEVSPVRSALDVGTGTGVLAMAALALGAERVVGTDNDPEAVRVAKENAAHNGVADRIEYSGADIADITETFELVVANILAGPLVDLAPDIARAVAPGGRLMLSGVLGTQAEEVTAAYLAQGLREPEVTARDEWVRIDLRREG